MDIPDRYSGRDFSLVLLNMARELLHRCSFPVKLYDNDVVALCEEIAHDTYVRILEMDGECVQSSGLFYVTMRFIVLEKRKAAWKARNSGWEKSAALASIDEQPIDALENIVDGGARADQDTKDRELFAIIIEELQRLPNRWSNERRAAFRQIVLQVFSEDISFSDAWERVSHNCPDSPSRANAFLWWNRLLIAVFKAWAPEHELREAER